MSKHTGLVLSGGGARGAYQAGVLKAITQIAQETGQQRLFSIITGISAGAINGTFLATGADDLTQAAERLCGLWSGLKTEDIFRADPVSLGRIGLQTFTQLTTGSITHQNTARSLLDTRPLSRFLRRNLPLYKIRENLEKGYLNAVAVTATDYTSSTSTTFVEAIGSAPQWHRVRRKSEQTILSVDHVMASSAIPILFPPIQVGERAWGDGGLRNMAPLSPAIHLGSKRLVIVGVKSQNPSSFKEDELLTPSLAQILSAIINGILMDSIDSDVERLSRINRTLNAVDRESHPEVTLQPIDHLWFHPSENLGDVALQWAKKMPKTLKFLMGGLGSLEEGADLISYLLFEDSYCRELIDIGYQDTVRRKDEVLAFLSNISDE